MPTSEHVQRKTELKSEYIPYLACAEDILETAGTVKWRRSAQNEKLLVAQNAGVSLCPSSRARRVYGQHFCTRHVKNKRTFTT